MLIGDILRRQAAPAGRPQKPALLYQGEAVTYADLHARANRLAQALVELGVRRGDRVALLGRNSPAWVESYFAAAICGAILVPVNFWYRGAELAYVLADSGATACLAAAGCAGIVSEARAGCDPYPPGCAVRHWIWLDARPDPAKFPEAVDDPTVAALVAGMPAPPLPSLGEPGTRGDPRERAAGGGVRAAHAGTHAVELDVHEEDPHIILYTSGTTGFPKGAVLSHRAHAQHAATFALLTRAVEEDVYLNVYPLFHTGGTDCAVLPYLYAGATVALLSDPKPAAVLDAMERYRVTAMMAVPTVWRRLVEHPSLARRDLHSFRRAMGSSDAMPLDLLEIVLERFGATWTQTYGLTEAGCILTYLQPPDQRRKIGSAGKPHPQADLFVADPVRSVDADWPLRPEDRLPPGAVGEVVARTEHAMSAYWNKPEQTAASLRNGFIRTGDLGRLDEEGYLYIAGRLKDVIITGGENVYPAEVEPVLRQYPGIREVALVGVPDREWGETVLAVVVPQPAAGFDAEAFRAWARRRVAGYKTPRHVVTVDDLPRTTGTGKIQKAALRERFRERFGDGSGSNGAGN